MSAVDDRNHHFILLQLLQLFKGRQKFSQELDPVESTVRYGVMKLCTGSVKDINGWYLAVLSQYEAVKF